MRSFRVLDDILVDQVIVNKFVKLLEIRTNEASRPIWKVEESTLKIRVIRHPAVEKAIATESIDF